MKNPFCQKPTLLEYVNGFFSGGAFVILVSGGVGKGGLERGGWKGGERGWGGVGEGVGEGLGKGWGRDGESLACYTSKTLFAKPHYLCLEP